MLTCVPLLTPPLLPCRKPPARRAAGDLGPCPAPYLSVLPLASSGPPPCRPRCTSPGSAGQAGSSSRRRSRSEREVPAGQKPALHRSGQDPSPSSPAGRSGSPLSSLWHRAGRDVRGGTGCGASRRLSQQSCTQHRRNFQCPGKWKPGTSNAGNRSRSRARSRREAASTLPALGKPANCATGDSANYIRRCEKKKKKKKEKEKKPKKFACWVAPACYR